MNLLIPVLPLYLEGLGQGSFAAGSATTLLMAGTVAAQVCAPRVLRAWGYAPTLLAGLVLLGVPAALYPYMEGLSPILLVTLVRGVGFGLATVAFAALVAQAAPLGRRGEAIGLYGVASTLPAVLGLPLGVWIASNIGYGATFAVGVASPLAGLACLLAARVRTPVARDGGNGLRSALGKAPLRRPLLVFLSSTVATGFLVTFLPLAAPSSGFGSAAAALLVWGATQTAARWWAGRFGDRSGASRLIPPSLLLSAAGMLAASQADNAPLLLLGAALNGLGFGVLQNATIAVLLERVSRREYGTVSALWNVGFDAGAGLGPLLLGPAVAIAGFAPTSVAAAGLMLAALLLVRLDGAGTTNPRTGV